MAYEASFGQWMIQRRKQLRLQRTELAAQIGCAAITLRKIETDERRPSQQLAVLLAERLGLNAHECTTFVKVARGKLPADYLSTLVSQASTPSTTLTQHAAAPQREPIRTLRTNLPAPLTSFVGREQELAAIPDLIQNHRLVTLTGVGGVGKTRVAIEAGIRIIRGELGVPPQDGVWIVELAPIAEPNVVVQTLARIFNVQDQRDQTTLEALQEHLAEKQLLLILDNCEHLIDACATIVEQLLLHCWQLQLLATSRESLRIPGERIYPIMPLTLPEPSETRPTKVLATTAAQLFVARMDTHAAAGSNTIDSTKATAIAQICRQLDGIPLALELAAPLTHSMPLIEIANQLTNQMAILTNTYRTAIPRHQTMHTALVWSYRLLAPAEQHVLAQVAVFAGGWTLAAAQAVCGDRVTHERIWPALQQLVAKSLALQEEAAGERRYRLLEPVRQFAQAQLAASGHEEDARHRHAIYFLGQAEQMHHARDTSNEEEWLNRLEPERDNLRAVNAWAIERGEAEIAHRFNGWMFAFWIYRSSHVEAYNWTKRVLTIKAAQQTPETQMAEALALDTAGYLATTQRDHSYAAACFQHELEIYSVVGHQPSIASAYRGLGFAEMQRGNLDLSRVYTASSLEISQAVDDHWGVAWSLFDLGYLALVYGDYAEAQTKLEQAIPKLFDQDILYGASRALLALAHLMRLIGDDQQALECYAKALQIHKQRRYVQKVADAIDGVAGIIATRGYAFQAALLFGAAQAHNDAYATLRWQHLDAVYAKDIALTRSLLSPQQWQAAWERGYAMQIDAAVDEALAQVG